MVSLTMMARLLEALRPTPGWCWSATRTSWRRSRPARCSATWSRRPASTGRGATARATSRTGRPGRRATARQLDTARAAAGVEPTSGGRRASADLAEAVRAGDADARSACCEAAARRPGHGPGRARRSTANGGRRGCGAAAHAGDAVARRCDALEPAPAAVRAPARAVRRRRTGAHGRALARAAPARRRGRRRVVRRASRCWSPRTTTRPGCTTATPASSSPTATAGGPRSPRRRRRRPAAAVPAVRGQTVHAMTVHRSQGSQFARVTVRAAAGGLAAAHPRAALHRGDPGQQHVRVDRHGGGGARRRRAGRWRGRAGCGGPSTRSGREQDRRHSRSADLLRTATLTLAVSGAAPSTCVPSPWRTIWPDNLPEPVMGMRAMRSVVPEWLRRCRPRGPVSARPRSPPSWRGGPASPPNSEPGLRGVDGQGQAGVGRAAAVALKPTVQRHRRRGGGKRLAPGVVQPDVVRGPAGAEGVAAGGQLADEIGQRPVVGVAAGLGAEDGRPWCRRRPPSRGRTSTALGSRKQ